MKIKKMTLKERAIEQTKLAEDVTKYSEQYDILMADIKWLSDQFDIHNEEIGMEEETEEHKRTGRILQERWNIDNELSNKLSIIYDNLQKRVIQLGD
jgi:hypothetical protein